jgi:hypothetical protein
MGGTPIKERKRSRTTGIRMLNNIAISIMEFPSFLASFPLLIGEGLHLWCTPSSDNQSEIWEAVPIFVMQKWANIVSPYIRRDK